MTDIRCEPLAPTERARVAYVAAWLREWDRRECFAYNGGAEGLIASTLAAAARGPFAVCYLKGEEPFAVAFATRVSLASPDLQCGLYATETWDEPGVSARVLRHLLAHVRPLLARRGGVLWAETMEGHPDAPTFLSRLGARHVSSRVKHGHVWRRYEWRARQRSSSRAKSAAVA